MYVYLSMRLEVLLIALLLLIADATRIYTRYRDVVYPLPLIQQ